MIDIYECLGLEYRIKCAYTAEYILGRKLVVEEIVLQSRDGAKKKLQSLKAQKQALETRLTN